MGLPPLQIFLILQCGDRLWTSESDVCRRQILTTKVYPRAVRVNPEILVHKPWRPIVFFQFEIIINVLVSSFGFI